MTSFFVVKTITNNVKNNKHLVSQYFLHYLHMIRILMGRSFIHGGMHKGVDVAGKLTGSVAKIHQSQQTHQSSGVTLGEIEEENVSKSFDDQLLSEPMLSMLKNDEQHHHHRKILHLPHHLHKLNSEGEQQAHKPHQVIVIFCETSEILSRV